MKKNTKLDKPLLIVMLILMVFGLIMVLSASSMASYMRYHRNIYDYFIKQGLFMFVGLIIFCITIYLPTSFFKKLSPVLIIGTLLSLLGLIAYGAIYNSAQSWYDLKFFNLQPSEFAKPFIILYLANSYNNHRNDLDHQWNLLKPLFIPIICCACIITQPDLGTAMIIIGIIVLIFYALPLKKNIRGPISKILISGVVLSIITISIFGQDILQSYQWERLNFLDPCERYEEKSGYQLCNSFIAFKNGGLTGKGIGESTQKYLYLPEAHTDFIFSIIVEEWGLIVGIIIIILYGFILYRILKIAREATSLGNGIIAYGVFAYIFMHISVNLVGVIGLGPLTGVPLPFLSYGGSFLFNLLFCMGLVQRVHYETYKKNNPNKKS